MQKGRIFIISGVSGAGKTVLVDFILKERKGIVRAISYTTRSPRQNEVDGKDYYFIDKKHFLKKVEEGDLLEFSEVYGQLYGTGIESFKPIEEGIDVVKIMDVQGAMKLKKAHIKAVYVFLKVSKGVMKKRLKERSEKEVEIRLKERENELKYMKDFDVVIDTSGNEENIPENAKKVMAVMQKS